jgi:hypothetical protein
MQHTRIDTDSRGSLNIRQNPVPVSECPLKFPYGISWHRTRAASCQISESAILKVASFRAAGRHLPGSLHVTALVAAVCLQSSNWVCPKYLEFFQIWISNEVAYTFDVSVCMLLVAWGSTTPQYTVGRRDVLRRQSSRLIHTLSICKPNSHQRAQPTCPHFDY